MLTRKVTDRVSRIVLLAAGALSMLVFLLVRVPRAGDSLLSTDGPGYFSYLPSVIFDGDLDFGNDYARFPWYAPGCVECTPTQTGLVGNPCSVGPAILWIPFYLTAHALSLAARATGPPTSVDGYGPIYETAICIGTMTYVTTGCFIAYRLCRRYFPPHSSVLAVLGVYLASGLVHYAVAAPANSHALSFFTVSLFLLLWHPPRSRGSKEWALLGCAAGLMALVRWQDVLFAGVLVVEGIQALRATPAGARVAVLRQYLEGGLVAGLAAAAVFVPQMVAWSILYGSPVAVPQGTSFFDWPHPLLLEQLFSTRHGLFTWHPVTLLATLGIIALWRRDRKVTVALLGPLLLQWYLNSTLSDWWWESAFGARRFTSAAPVFVLGIAALSESVTARFRRGYVVMTGVVAALVAWNLLFELQFSWGFIPHDQAISVHQLTVGKFEMVLELLGRLLSKL